MKNILVHAAGDEGLTTRIESALAIGRRFGSHLSFLISSPYQQFIAADPFGGVYLAKEQLAQAQIADAELEQRLRAELEREDVPWDVAVADGDALSTMALAATLADLSLVSLDTSDRRGRHASTIAGDLALTVPVPVLALPADAPPIDLDAPVMVAWNGSPQAASALRAGVALMRDAASVTLVTVGDDDGRVAAEDALRYMSRHGVHGELRREAKGMDASEEVLVRVADEIGAGLVVMGAFGRSRLRETLFGGVTRFMLDVAPAPLLLMH
ncbi:universal stress protein [Sphingopyxis sp. LK2115]|jgi:nucleotide-binding universal stress UspA family protein|uniref:universal stress protein n=1 Tax=Sphingopyxis sp. LK2115 TaxID=2744558 RepID=UPI0016612C1B|nr:universal stress protein [Sphingopyxis sp. LK2115]